MKVSLSYQPKALTLLVLILVLIGSCTIQKRVHRKGWYVEWHRNKNIQNTSSSESNHQNAIQKNATRNTLPIHVDSQNDHTNPDIQKSQEVKQQFAQRQKMNGNSHKNIRISSNQKPSHSLDQDITLETKVAQDNLKSSADEFPNRVPKLAYALLFTGLLLLAIGIVGAIVFAAMNMSFIGLPLPYIASLLVGILLLVLATSVAQDSQKTQPSPPDPHYKKQAPKKEKKERKPLSKNDKIYLSIIGGLVIGILIAVLAY